MKTSLESIQELLEHDDQNKAVAEAESLLSQPSSDAELLRVVASLFFKKQVFDYAAQLFKRVLEQHITDTNIKMALSMALVNSKQFDEALPHLQSLLHDAAHALTARLFLGQAYQQLGDEFRAQAAFLQALRMVNKDNEKSLTPPQRSLLTHASKVVRSALREELRENALTASLSTAEKNRLEATIDGFTGMRPITYSHPKLRPGLLFIPEIPVRMFYEREEFPALKQIEQAFPEIKKEFLQILADFDRSFKPYISHPEHSAAARTWQQLNQSMDWSTFHLSRHGKDIPENTAKAPLTLQLLNQLTDLHRVDGYGPEIMFSALKPHTRIKAHHGPINGRLIVHLPLIVPANCGGIRVGTETRSWEEGKCLIFDDAYEHEAWNDSDELRVVLIFDIWNPDVSNVERDAYSTLLTTAQRFERSRLSMTTTDATT